MKRLHDSILEVIFRRNIELCFEFEWLYKVRNFRDGITITHELNFDFYKGDHTPQIRWSLTIFNVTVFDFQIYNMLHEEFQ